MKNFFFLLSSWITFIFSANAQEIIPAKDVIECSQVLYSANSIVGIQKNVFFDSPGSSMHTPNNNAVIYNQLTLNKNSEIFIAHSGLNKYYRCNLNEITVNWFNVRKSDFGKVQVDYPLVIPNNTNKAPTLRLYLRGSNIIINPDSSLDTFDSLVNWKLTKNNSTCTVDNTNTAQKSFIGSLKSMIQTAPFKVYPLDKVDKEYIRYLLEPCLSIKSIKGDIEKLIERRNK